MNTINYLILLIFSSIVSGKPLTAQNGHQSSDTDPTQWSSVPEVDESSMMQMLNSIMEMIRSQLSGWMYGARSNDDVEVDSSNRGFMSMIHGLFSRLSNMAMDMMGQMRRMRDKTIKERLQETPTSGEGDSMGSVTNASTLATRLRNQMETTKDRIKDAWNNLMKKYNNTMGSSSSAMTANSRLQNDEDQLIDDESKANRNLKSNDHRVIRSLDSVGDDQFEIVRSSYVNSVEPKVFDKLSSWVGRLSGESNPQGHNRFDSLIAAPSDENDSGRSRNIFDRMRGAMDNARSKFFGAIGKFMNGTMMNDPDDDSTNLTEEDQKNWWTRFKPKPANPTATPEREPLSPRGYTPTKTIHSVPMIPKEAPTMRNNYPDSSSFYRPHINPSTRSHPRVVPTESKVDLNDGDEPSRTTIEFMDKFKEEIERVRSSMDQSSNENLEMAMTKMANWGLFMRSISESKNLDDFWGKLTQRIN